MAEHVTIRVMVACAESDRAFLRELVLPQGTTAIQAIEASGLRAAWPDIEVMPECVGVYARKIDLHTTLRDGDRVEIYRPLRVDPKEARRKRALR